MPDGLKCRSANRELRLYNCAPTEPHHPSDDEQLDCGDILALEASQMPPGITAAALEQECAVMRATAGTGCARWPPERPPGPGKTWRRPDIIPGRMMMSYRQRESRAPLVCSALALPSGAYGRCIRRRSAVRRECLAA